MKYVTGFLCLFLALFFMEKLNAEEKKDKISYSENDWDILAIPADLNKDKTLYLLKDYAQILTFMFATVPDNMKYDYRAKIVVKLPPGTSTPGKNETLEGGNTFSDSFQLRKSYLMKLNEKIGDSVWQHHDIIIKLPGNSGEYQKIEVKLFINEKLVKTKTWPLHIGTLKEKGAPLKDLYFGLWDYGYRGCGYAAEEIQEFFLDAGINFNQSIIGDAKPLAGFTFGGSIHHGLFSNKNYLEYNLTGKAGVDDFCETQALIDNGPDIVEKAIEQMCKNVKTLNTLALFDYEPDGKGVGFSELSIKTFMKKYNVQESAFKKFHEKYKKLGYKIAQCEDPFTLSVYKKWVAFRSWQSMEYVRLIADAVRKKQPGAKVAVTCRASAGSCSDWSMALGCNNSFMAVGLDVIMPQIYLGYGSAAAKYTILETRKWKEIIKEFNPSCELLPIILVRYAGAQVFNTPERIRQQTIGAIAEGAKGVLMFYAQQLDARYWEMTAKTSRELAEVEDFYTGGERVGNMFKTKDMLHGMQEMNIWPGFNVTVENPDWHYTAHQLGDIILLTLFNFNDSNDTVFSFDKIPDVKEERLVNCKNLGDTKELTAYIVPPGEVAFITFKVK